MGATFLSGTTISNSLTELYLLFKYLRPQELERQDIRCFDAWAAIFAKTTTDFEFNVTNNVVQKERFRYFIKVPELAALSLIHIFSIDTISIFMSFRVCRKGNETAYKTYRFPLKGLSLIHIYSPVKAQNR